MRKILPPSDRFWSKVDKDGPVPAYRPDLGACWIWTAGEWPSGYGKFRTGGAGSAMIVSHKYAYEQHKGKVPEGLYLDHLCRVRQCVNPDHLEPVTMRVNILRGESPSAKNQFKTHCPQGHEYNQKNTYINRKGGRQCLPCIQARKNEGRRMGKKGW